jgi:hypothetical protein
VLAVITVAVPLMANAMLLAEVPATAEILPKRGVQLEVA